MSSGISGSSSANLVLSGAAYNNFVDTIKSDQTREQYKRCLVRFMRYCSITDIDNLLVLSQDSKTMRQKIIDYIGYLKRERNLGANAINLYVGSIFHFYSMNDITLNRKKIGRYIPENIQKNNDRAYTREEIASRALVIHSALLVHRFCPGEVPPVTGGHNYLRLFVSLYSCLFQ